ncbi:TIGR00730 family Rossman fold protein [Candidatus Saccharibacteria bacterium]|nr:TIGR00730 family Rossman fold protein [Candidatus Saccharibacteria bacterium]NCU40210.1 TIGR00730 family Rossman fold protein [Candidatus Saccharibacteria bacterium]
MLKKTKRKINVTWSPSRRMAIRRGRAKKRLINSDDEFDTALKILDRYPKRVTFFGSARDVPANEHLREQAYELAYKLAKNDYAIISGGGPGIMAASNKGAYEAGGVSIGFNIHLPREQTPNPHVTHSFEFHYFFTRKVTMTFYSHAYIYFPGGFGSLDELSEVLTLIQTKKMPPLRVILFGSSYWNNFAKFIREQMLENGYISPGDDDIFVITDDVDEALELVNTGYDS